MGDKDTPVGVRTPPYWITDPGHGWLIVSKTDYPDAVDAADAYCYEFHDLIALEEDCAAGRFLAEHPEFDGTTLEDTFVQSNAYRNPRVMWAPFNTDKEAQ
jgi:hypothetical protein